MNNSHACSISIRLGNFMNSIDIFKHRSDYLKFKKKLVYNLKIEN